MGRRRRPRWSTGRAKHRGFASPLCEAGNRGGRVPQVEVPSAAKPQSTGNKLQPAPRVDLFGAPVLAPRGPGRPCHAPTDALREQVRDLRSQSDPVLTHLEIAAAIGLTAPTLRLHYHAELGSSSQAWRRREGEETR